MHAHGDSTLHLVIRVRDHPRLLKSRSCRRFTTPGSLQSRSSHLRNSTFWTQYEIVRGKTDSVMLMERIGSKLNNLGPSYVTLTFPSRTTRRLTNCKTTSPGKELVTSHFTGNELVSRY